MSAGAVPGEQRSRCWKLLPKANSLLHVHFRGHGPESKDDPAVSSEAETLTKSERELLLGPRAQACGRLCSCCLGGQR